MPIGKTVGLDKHIKKLRSFGDGMEAESMQQMMIIGEQVRQHAMESIRQGTVRGRGHIPSQPGQPPKGDSGQLELSIEVLARRTEKSVVVIANAPHAGAMEFGTSTILPRPYMRPALRAHRARFVSAIVALFTGRGARVFKGR